MDKQGNIWFTANFKAYIGKFEPKRVNLQNIPRPRGPRSSHAHL